MSGTRAGTGAEVARHVLATVASGHPLPTDLVEQLVSSVLDREEVRLALAVREGGPTVVRRAIELAAVLIDHEAEEAPPRSAEKRS